MFAAMQLGKGHPKAHPHTLRLAKYAVALPPHPAELDYAAPSYEMHANDEIGDCTIVGLSSCIRTWSHASSGVIADVSTDVVRATYSAWTGYDPSRPETDQGAIETDVLARFRDEGIGGHKIEAWADCSDRITDSISLTGCAYLGLALPIAAQSQSRWDIDPVQALNGQWAPGSWGGHCVVAVGYTQSIVRLATWGRIVECSWLWLSTYMDEAYALISPEWLRSDGLAVSGFDVATLKADIAALRGGP
jgi:hypothetical protein